jgi:N-carbamoylputrescine amidase
MSGTASKVTASKTGRIVTVAAIQMACDADRETNVARAIERIREAASRGAEIVLLPELFEGPYFCKDQEARYFDEARPFRDNPTIARLSELARSLGVVLPVSFFEAASNAFFNSVAVIDADGAVLGLYRKSHVPDGPGYCEKFYFSPGDTGFRVWPTRFGTIGVGICWDQWFPETARAMALKGAELLFYPSAIGSEPSDPAWDSSGHWRRVMQGHAGANLVPLIAVNRIGAEQGTKRAVSFYGTSFIADEIGAVVTEAGRGTEEIIVAAFDLDATARRRRAWGLFRDRRPDLYRPLLTLDGGGET